jgi:hypothetical protein
VCGGYLAWQAGFYGMSKVAAEALSPTTDAIHSVDLTPRREDTATDTVWS